jgi:TonB family protein
MTLRLLCTIALLSIGSALGAQSAPDSAQCHGALEGVTPDSQSTRISVLVFPMDTANHLTPAYSGLIGAGIRQFLTLPKPMPLHVYDRTAVVHPGVSDPGFAVLTLRSAYRAMLHRDGHLTQIRTVSGTRDAAFDGAILVAMAQLSASELLPPPEAPAATFNGDSLDLRIVVTPDAKRQLPQVVNWPASEGVTPVMLLRLPIRRITQDPRSKGGSDPLYPTELRLAGVEGRAVLEFVVDTSGWVDPNSAAVISATAPQFVQAVADVLPDMRFEPLRVEGCAVSVLIQQPFNFTLGR